MKSQGRNQTNNAYAQPKNKANTFAAPVSGVSRSIAATSASAHPNPTTGTFHARHNTIDTSTFPPCFLPHPEKEGTGLTDRTPACGLHSPHPILPLPLTQQRLLCSGDGPDPQVP